MRIRFQLLTVALTTLILPWAGCEYARELETTLRVSQENALQARADTIAQALAAQPAKVLRDPRDAEPFDAEQGDQYVFPLKSAPALDGYREDWGLGAAPTPLSSNSQYAVRAQFGSIDPYLYVYVEVDDPVLVPEPNDAHASSDHFNRVNMTLFEPDDSSVSYFFATAAPGLIEAQSWVAGTDGMDGIALEPRVQAYWLQTQRGYHLEVRIPSSLVGSRLWLEVVDGDGSRKAGFMGADTFRGGRLFSLTPGLDALLATFVKSGTRATVVDENTFELGRAGSLGVGAHGSFTGSVWLRRALIGDISHWPREDAQPGRMTGASVIAALAGRSTAEWLRSDRQQAPLLSASAPLVVGDRTRGAVVLQQAADELLGSRDQALARLMRLTVLATCLSVAVAFGVATWISVRVGRLREAADAAIGGDGVIRKVMPEADRSDEIGALARAYQRLLSRLDEHGHYLRTLGGKLSHELRTPLTIVRSSLDNLESEGIRADQQGYLTRARQGVQRLQSILTALGAASRVEESIKLAERVNVNLNELLDGAVAGYRSAFPRARIELHVPADACPLRASPELMVQMLDKLIENAVDFTPLGGVISVRLERLSDRFELSVTNDGPPIPDTVLGRLFESLFEQREGVDDKPHFGLGLYIVRLIAEFHGGHALAANRSDASGARFSVMLPLI